MTGLSSKEAKTRLAKFGPNAIPEKKVNHFLVLIKKLWGPIPWMLEISLILEIVIGNYIQGMIIGVLLIVNAIISFIQENRSQKALSLLRSKLTINARVFRDNSWSVIPAHDLVPGDFIHMRLGDFIPADVKINKGSISVDQSMITGESLPVELEINQSAYSGSVIQRGEADAEVVATGSKSKFGKTASLVQLAKSSSRLAQIVFGIVRYMLIIDIILVIAVILYALGNRISLWEILPFSLMLLVASVPIALPATFTLASSIGAHELIKKGIYTTRLPAIQEAAEVDLLCCDKTGTITQNKLKVSSVIPFPPHSIEELIAQAAIASDESSQDSIDLAILSLAKEKDLLKNDFQRIEYTPFNPIIKRTEMVINQGDNQLRIVKGSPEVVKKLVKNSYPRSQELQNLSEHGDRIIAIASGNDNSLSLIGWIGFSDPIREDSKESIDQLKQLGIRVLMMTGDGILTAKNVAGQVGLGQSVCNAAIINKPRDISLSNCDVMAEILPEDKYKLVRYFQQKGHVVGMTGDGVNDSPALKQAEVGIAVANATDIAKAAASIILTTPGLCDIQSIIVTGRQIYQRMLSYTLNKIIKTFLITFFLSIGFLLTGIFITSPLHIILLLLANDFVTMSLSTDNVSYSEKPERWDVKSLIFSSAPLAFGWLIFSFAILYLGLNYWHLQIPQLQTLIFTMMVFTGQANVYLIRERKHFWKSIPSKPLLISSLLDILVVCIIAVKGFLISPINFNVVIILLIATILYFILLDQFKLVLNKFLKV